MEMTITLLTEVGAVPAGTCPFCHRPLDEGGCRLGARWISADLRAPGGVEQVVDVVCARMPAARDADGETDRGRAEESPGGARASVSTFAGLANLTRTGSARSSPATWQAPRGSTRGS